MMAPTVLWSVFIHQAINIVFGVPMGYNVEWTNRRLLNSTDSDIEPEKSIFEKIKEFYDDPNNLAMWGVLPLIILVYGGFCVIYCVCKGYDDCKKKKNKKAKKKRLKDEDDEIMTANSSGENNNNTKKSDTSDQRSADIRNHPDPRSATRAAAAFNMKQNTRKQTASTSDVKLALDRENSTPLPCAIPDDDDSFYPTKPKGNHPPPPQAMEAKPILKPYKPPNRKPHPDMHMPPSPPPPYEDFGRRDSVEEISMNPKKVRSVSNKANDPRKAMNAMEQYALARQAAQLLRVENGQAAPGRKGQKRLVFVAT